MLLDTNIVSYFFRRDSRATLYERHLVGKTRYISFITLGELYRWLFVRSFSQVNKRRLLAHIAEHVIVPYDDELVWKRAELSATCRASGHAISMEDAWIAATALRNRLPSVIHNPRHFRQIEGLALISEGPDA
jgi:predicted nucleic acid-binding protein